MIRMCLHEQPVGIPRRRHAITRIGVPIDDPSQHDLAFLHAFGGEHIKQVFLTAEVVVKRAGCIFRTARQLSHLQVQKPCFANHRPSVAQNGFFPGSELTFAPLRCAHGVIGRR